MSLPFFCNQTAFFMYFYVPFHFFKVPFEFVCLPKAAFCKLRHIGVPQKGEKCHFSFSLIKRHFCMYFYVPFLFLKSVPILSSLQTQPFARIKRIGVAPKGGKTKVFFYSNRMAFFMYFYVLFHFFKVPFNFVFRSKSSILQG